MVRSFTQIYGPGNAFPTRAGGCSNPLPAGVFSLLLQMLSQICRTLKG